MHINTEMIQNALMASFEKWGLREGKLSLMLRDSAANGAKSCDDWGIKHASCINHILHLLVGPFLVMKKKKECNEDDGDKDALVDGDDVFEDNDDTWTDNECMKYVRCVVNNFWKATKFLKRSIKYKELLEKIQYLQQMDCHLSVHLDVRTRWNSTYLMLQRMVKMQTTIDQFQVYYKSAEGK